MASSESGNGAAPAIVPYPAANHHGVIGDRRTAALVAADGTIDWLCLPDYDGTPVFGALLDAARGGFWRVGPERLWMGAQQYADGTTTVVTRWTTADYELELRDTMALPSDERRLGSSETRVIVRVLRCLRGSVRCVSLFRPSIDFTPIDPAREGKHGGVGALTCWSSLGALEGRAGAAQLQHGEQVWMVFEAGGRTQGWTVECAARLVRDAEEYWSGMVKHAWSGLDPRLVRSAITIRLLEFQPSGSVVAAPTTSLPERIGGRWNVDYRLTWIRDASLSMWALARLGDLESAGRYLGWLGTRPPMGEAPLQVLYDIRGGASAEQHERTDIEGYRGSLPVRRGNHAYRQHQMDIFGYLADCAWVYLDRGGKRDDSLLRLLRRAAEYVATHWRDAGNGIWELPVVQHYVSTLVMCWVALDRVSRIVRRIDGDRPEIAHWRAQADEIRKCVLTHGWSRSLGAFQQSLENEALDASSLLVAVTGFLPADDERVAATVDRVAQRLTIDGCVYRFDPAAVAGFGTSAMGQFEAAFLPCTFWLATASAMLGRHRDAEDILARAERVARRLGLLAEGLDPRTDHFSGNSPLLFSHVEYMRARWALQAAA